MFKSTRLIALMIAATATSLPGTSARAADPQHSQPGHSQPGYSQPGRAPLGRPQPGRPQPSPAGRALQAACWPSPVIGGLAGEQHPVKGGAGASQPLPTGALQPFAPVPLGLRGAIRRVKLPPGKKLVALTLDLCESGGEVAGYDAAIIDYLRTSNTKATLFTGGKWMMSHPGRTQQLMVDPLFEMANHGWAHRNARSLTGSALLDEILGPQRAYEGLRAEFANAKCVTSQAKSPGLPGVPPRIGLFRFPFGACHAPSLAAVNNQGLLAIQWDVSTGDPSPATSAAQIAQAMISQTRPGSIIIAHANGRGYHTAEGLPLAIPKLRAMGYEFVTVSELLAAGEPVVVDTCYDSRPGDTDKYDFLGGLKRPALKAGPKASPTDAPFRRQETTIGNPLARDIVGFPR
jgi:peptidoglycan-N-acetylglucosamine deacetylase